VDDSPGRVTHRCRCSQNTNDGKEDSDREFHLELSGRRERRWNREVAQGDDTEEG
jgi:hypothetical protein